MGTGGKAATGREADHSHPSRTGFKNTWSYTSTPQNVILVWYLVKHMENFTFLLPEEYSVNPEIHSIFGSSSNTDMHWTVVSGKSRDSSVV
jgi:hypothetical protein